MMINNDNDKKTIRQMMGEIVNSMTRDEAEKDLRKELYKRLKDEMNIEPKIARKVVKAMYRGNFAEEREAYEEMEALYKSVQQIRLPLEEVDAAIKEAPHLSSYILEIAKDRMEV